MKMGRPRKTTAELKIHGNYRADRHAGRADAAPKIGEPQKPSWLGEIGSVLWDHVVPDLSKRGLVGPSDSFLLAGMCRNWQHWRKCDELADIDPTDKETRVALLGYWAAFERTAAKFGLSAVDLANLKLPPAADKPPGPTGFARKRG